MISFAVQVDILPLVYFCFCYFVFGVRFKTSSPKLVSSCLLPLFSSRTFMVSSLKIKSLIDFWVKFYVWCKTVVQFHFLHEAVSFSQHQKGRCYPFSIVYSSLLCHKLAIFVWVYFWVLDSVLIYVSVFMSVNSTNYCYCDFFDDYFFVI